MLDSIGKPEAARARPHVGAGWMRCAFGLQAVAGLVGAAGVMLAAAAAHKGGGDLTAIAATFAILHAGAICALTGVSLAVPRAAPALLAAGAIMAVGTVLFSGDLALGGLFALHPWPQAAPVGGTALIVAWLAVAGSAAVRAVRG